MNVNFPKRNSFSPRGQGRGGRGRGANRVTPFRFDDFQQALDPQSEFPPRGAPRGRSFRGRGRGRGRGMTRGRKNDKRKQQPEQEPQLQEQKPEENKEDKPATEVKKKESVNKPGFRVTNGDLPGKLLLTAPLVLKSMIVTRSYGFGFTFYGIVCYLFSYVIPMFKEKAGPELHAQFNDRITCQRFVKIFLHICEVKMKYAYLKQDLKPCAHPMPELDEEYMVRVSKLCLKLPKILNDIIKHLGMVCVDEQKVFPVFPETQVDRIKAFIPSLMTQELITHFYSVALPDLRIFLELQQFYPNVISGHRITRGNQDWVMATPLTRDDFNWWNNLVNKMASFEELILTDLTLGEGELGQLINCRCYPEADATADFYSQAIIPDGVLAHGIAYGVGITPSSQDRHTGLGRNKAAMFINGDQNSMRNALTQI